MKLLTIDTTTNLCSLALNLDGEIFAAEACAARAHTQHLFPLLDKLLRDHALAIKGLDAIAFGAGPGSFTGLRIAASVTQGLAIAHDLPVIPIGSLRALAAGIETTSPVVALFDARQGAVYAGCYHAVTERCLPICPDWESTPDKLSLPIPDAFVLAGEGARVYASTLQATFGHRILDYYPDAPVHAEHIARLAALEWQAGHIVPASEAIPVYIRNRVVG